MTFDKKGTAVAKKKKTDSPAAQEDASKVGKGESKAFFPARCCSFTILSSHPRLTLLLFIEPCFPHLWPSAPLLSLCYNNRNIWAP